MEWQIAPLTEAEAIAIGRWHYGEPYAFYDFDRDPDDLAELLDPASWPGRYFAAHDATGTLVGFFQFASYGDTVAIGLGLRPDLTGRGIGGAFLLAGLDFARERFAPRHFALAVAAFDVRAINVYSRAGFRVPIASCSRPTVASTNSSRWSALPQMIQPHKTLDREPPRR